MNGHINKWHVARSGPHHLTSGVLSVLPSFYSRIPAEFALDLSTNDKHPYSTEKMFLKFYTCPGKIMYHRKNMRLFSIPTLEKAKYKELFT